MYHGWFRLCLSADGSTATAGEEEAPAPGHLPFWFKPVSAFGLFKFTTFISSSPELAMPSTLVLDRLSASSRRVLSRETRPPGSGEVTLSQELRTVGFLRPHVLVGYQWSHTGLCPGCQPVITATSAASCRTPPISVCHRTGRFPRKNHPFTATRRCPTVDRGRGRDHPLSDTRKSWVAPNVLLSLGVVEGGFAVLVVQGSIPGTPSHCLG